MMAFHHAEAECNVVLTDAKKQSQMAALSKERESLQNTIQAYKTMFHTQQSLVAELRGRCTLLCVLSLSVCLSLPLPLSVYVSLWVCILSFSEERVKIKFYTFKGSR